MKVLRVVPNLPAAESQDAFYGGFLDLEQVMDHGWIATWAVRDSVTAQISVIAEDATAPMAPTVSIGVDDVDAFHQEAMRRGIEIVYGPVDEPWGVRRFFVRDPAGTVINIVGHR